MNEILWRARAARQLRKLPPAAQRDIRDAVRDKLAQFPNCSGVKRLTDHEFPYRLRVGDYRVFFEFEGGIRVVHIEDIRRRNERTY